MQTTKTWPLTSGHYSLSDSSHQSSSHGCHLRHCSVTHRPSNPGGCAIYLQGSLTVTVRVFSKTPRGCSVPQHSSSSLEGDQCQVRSDSRRGKVWRGFWKPGRPGLCLVLFLLIPLSPCLHQRGCSEIRLQSQEVQIKCFNVLPQENIPCF